VEPKRGRGTRESMEKTRTEPPQNGIKTLQMSPPQTQWPNSQYGVGRHC